MEKRMGQEGDEPTLMWLVE